LILIRRSMTKKRRIHRKVVAGRVRMRILFDERSDVIAILDAKRLSRLFPTHSTKGVGQAMLPLLRRKNEQAVANVADNDVTRW